MTGGELLTLFRSEMNDRAPPFLWETDEAYGYIDDAQIMFCRLTEGIADGITPAVTQLVLASRAVATVTAGTHIGNAVTITVTGAVIPQAGNRITVAGATGARAPVYNGTYYVSSVTGLLVTYRNPNGAVLDPANDAAVGTLTASFTLGVGYLDLHPSIMKIRDVTRADDGRNVGVINREDMKSRGMRLDGQTGTLQALITGESDNQVRVWPAPTENLTLNLLVFRLPLLTVSGDTEDTPLEIGVRHHRHLLMWAKSLAYGKQDAETLDRNKQNDFEMKFAAYCGQVQEEQRRARHKPRAVEYGGI